MDALEIAGILHCDITPGNIFIVSQTGEKRRLDFLDATPDKRKIDLGGKFQRLPHRGALGN